MRRLIRLLSVLLLSLCVLVACGPSQEAKKVASTETENHSGRWNETDAKPVVDSMTKDMLQGQWLQRWTTEHERRPTVVVGPVRNKTAQRIDESAIIRPVAHHLKRSGKIQLMALSEKEREALRHEPDSMCEPPQFLDREKVEEMKADLIVLGTVSSKVLDKQSGDKVNILYTVNLELINLEKTVKAWLAEKEIEKTVARNKTSPLDR